jgi:hypothetical protein
MDAERFDRIARQLSTGVPRRVVMKAAAAGAVGGLLALADRDHLVSDRALTADFATVGGQSVLAQAPHLPVENFDGVLYQSRPGAGQHHGDGRHHHKKGHHRG